MADDPKHGHRRNVRIAGDDLLKRVRSRYLGSGDYNGLYLDPKTSRTEIDDAVDLVRSGMAEVITNTDWMNPHIRPWPSSRTIDEQIASLLDLPKANYGLCLYPTALGMRGVRLPKRLDGRPFDQSLAKGKGALELAYFDFDVLEPYRNDPRYRFSYDDFGASLSVTDDVYLDDSASERDKVSLSHIGFAYDLSQYDDQDIDSPILRRVAAFYGDLARLTPEHQKRWQSYQVPSTGLEPHPVWFGTQMGRWPDGSGPFFRLVAELRNINALWANAFTLPLFRATERPRELGWLLRASQRDWDEFVHQLDKLLSDNIDHKALDAAGAPRTNANGEKLGTLSRMYEFMLVKRVPEYAAKDVMRPLRDVREARQAPAHQLRTNISSQTFIHRQIALLERLNLSLHNIRAWLTTHPVNHKLQLPYTDEQIGDHYRM